MKPIVLDAPNLQVVLSALRDEKTSTTQFRRNLRLAGYLATHEIVTLECSTKPTSIKTPMAKASGAELKENILQVMVMRAGEPFTEGGARLLDELNSSRTIGVVDARRMEESQEGMTFGVDISSFKVPKFNKDAVVIVYDPMLATGSTILAILDRIKKKGKPKKIIFCCVIAASYGIKRLEKHFPDVQVYTLAIDQKLDKRGYIIPGLGDCGDRAFGGL
ncbi:TPA: uracil phosphoribosyltransferase [Candidatus Woesearchaeota archaeon]|nr:uracil phosphoribosyltransferase [Candidatus Woesearchaeota archaeon]